MLVTHRRSVRRTGQLLLSMLALAIGLNACASSVSPDHGAFAALDENGRGQAVVSDLTDDDQWPSDPITIEKASVTGDSLAVMVVHGGGCADHSYQLVISRIWMESNPVQVPARVSHNAHGDNCRALIRRDLRISLAPLADAYRATYKQAHGTVSIRLVGSSAALLYAF